MYFCIKNYFVLNLININFINFVVFVLISLLLLMFKTSYNTKNLIQEPNC